MIRKDANMRLNQLFAMVACIISKRSAVIVIALKRSEN